MATKKGKKPIKRPLMHIATYRTASHEDPAIHQIALSKKTLCGEPTVKVTNVMGDIYVSMFTLKYTNICGACAAKFKFHKP